MSHPVPNEPTPHVSSATVAGSSPSPAQDPERYWLENVYQGGARQLTVRAVISGMLIGGVMCLSNLYVILKMGWSMGVTITSCILAYTVFSVLRQLKLLRTEFTPLENNAMGSVASAAGYMTGGGNMIAVPAVLMLTGVLPSSGWLILWFTVVAMLGVFAAIPIKRQLINIEALPFPTGTATAETINALHGHGEVARQKSRLLGLAGLIGAVIAVARDARSAWMEVRFPEWLRLPWLPAEWSLPFTLRGRPAGDWTLAIQPSLLLVGAGALMSWKTGWSMLLGAVLTYGFLAPAMADPSVGAITVISYKGINGWMLWTGAAVLITSGLLSFALEWRSVVRSFRSLSGLFGKKEEAPVDPLAGIECPPAWFPMGFAILGPIVVVLMAYLFKIPLWAGIIALPLAVLMGIIASRVTGETDNTPTKALGPVTQFIYGGMVPGNITANLMAANATGGVGLHSADLLTDLKSGWLLGANPRQQFFAQLFGVVAGALVVVPAFHLIIDDPKLLGSKDFPAPASLVWAGVAEMLSKGLSSLHPTARVSAACGAVLGIALVLLERLAPKRLKPFIPSASGFGLAIVLPASNSFSFFIGAATAEVLRRFKPKLSEAAVLPVGSGFIAGESLMGIAIAMLKALKFMPK
ncbi:OPT family oligopeptide transporter [Hyalangium rubrum]|uniref:OPT family oligopeptide transporter n=1 Tax=Hyalangium rubrum TaxID=3103134 RepID=A0ABU5GWN7_9BACT|nr:OPT family oligopeptide transporter [Hyalangium sp. s54d21]MDY7225608.1 OPT family oligopeptide transporter [Hyalangium sp. s54d21]